MSRKLSRSRLCITASVLCSFAAWGEPQVLAQDLRSPVSAALIGPPAPAPVAPKAAPPTPAADFHPELTRPVPLSVYQVNAWVDGPVIGVTALGSLVTYAFGNRLIHPRCPCDLGEVNALDRHVIGNTNVFLDTTSDITAGVAIAAPILADYLDLGLSQEWVEDMTVYAETLSVNGALVTLAKYTVQRPLPRVYAGQDPTLAASPGGYRSFYSGHTSVVVSSLSASAVTLNLRHHSGIWPWLVTAGVGVAVAAERVAAGRHFYTDVAVGAVAGALVGTIVPLLHRRNRESESQVMLAPTPDGAVLTWERRI